MNKKIWFIIFLFFCLFFNIIIDFNIKNYFNILKKCFNRDIILTGNLYSIICFIIAIISIFIILDIYFIIFKSEKENKGIILKNEDGTYGTANWMTESEVPKILGINDTPGIILGRYNNNLVKLPFDSFLNKNIAVFGSSGSMKTIRIFIN